jgi:hypothetical protein
VAIILRDPGIERIDRLGRALDQLEIEIAPADQRPSDPVTRIVAPRDGEDARQD